MRGTRTALWMRGNPIESRPALLGRRVLAYLADCGLILLYVVLLFGVSVALRVPIRAAALFENPWLAQAVGFLTLTLPVALFLTFFESSERMATPGKRLLGLVVSDLDGRRLGRGRAFVRSLAKLLPWEVAHVFVWRVPRTGAEPFPLWLLVGFCLVLLLVAVYLVLPLVTRVGQSLHDRVAGTVVRVSLARSPA